MTRLGKKLSFLHERDLWSMERNAVMVIIGGGVGAVFHAALAGIFAVVGALAFLAVSMKYSARQCSPDACPLRRAPTLSVATRGVRRPASHVRRVS